MTNNAQVFVSYSRKNIEFAQRLVESLSKNDRDVWVDWEDIPRASDWMDEIYSGIDNADTFLFVVSEHSLVSEICNQELAHALKSNKRVIPLVIQKVEDDIYEQVKAHWKTTTWQDMAHKNWRAVKHLNWLIFDNPEKYDAELDALVQTLDQDLFHIKTHTRLLVRAREWMQKSQNKSSLLVGDDVIAAEQWLQNYQDVPPKPSSLHQSYILKSREVENEKIAHDQMLQARARQRLQIMCAGFGIIILMMVFVLLPIARNILENQLGDDTDNRLLEAALSFEQLIADDLSFAEIAAKIIADSPSFQIIDGLDDISLEEFNSTRDDFNLQEISFYPADFQSGDTATQYGGPDRSQFSQRVVEEREGLILEALEGRNAVSRVIIGTPESQVVGAVSVFRQNSGSPWNLLGVVVVAYHINDDYAEDLSNILNVDALIFNPEHQLVATSLENNDTLRDNIQFYDDEFGLFHTENDIYFDYAPYGDDEFLRAVSTALIFDDEVQGYMLVARSFEAVESVKDQLSILFISFSVVILIASITLLVFLVGIPMLRERQHQTQLS